VRFLLGSTDSSLWALAIVKFKASACGFDGQLLHLKEQVLNGEVGFHDGLDRKQGVD
jgi:hypothetical protein